MAVSLSERVRIDAPAQTVFAYLVDIQNDTGWQKSTKSTRVSSDGPIQVGSTGVHTIKRMGMTDEFGWTVSEFEPGKRSAFTLTSGPATGGGGYSLDASDEGTTLTFAAEYQVSGFRRLLEPLVGSMMAKELRTDLQTLKDILESGA